MNKAWVIRVWSAALAVLVLVVLAGPIVESAQQAERMRRIGVLHYLVPAGTAGIGLDRRSQPAHRLPVERR